MKYTQKGPFADKQVQEHLDIVVDEIIRAIEDPFSVILYGGFGRGEGSIKQIDDRVIPVNDYDVYVITETRVEDDILENIAKTVATKWGKAGIEFHSFSKEQTLEDSFYLDLKCLTLDQLRILFPLVRYYELKNATTIIYGEDVRDLIPDYKVTDIPLSEGVRLLLNRMTHLVEYLSLEGKHDSEMVKYFCAKAYVDICTALLILSRRYSPTYRTRLNTFVATYESDFPDLYKRLPDLSEKVTQFTEYKLDLNREVPGELMDIWFQTRDDIFEVTKYFIGKFVSQRVESIVDLSNTIRTMGKWYYAPYLRFFLKMKFGVDSRLLAVSMVPFLASYFRFLYFKALWMSKEPYVRSLLNWEGPDLLIFSALPDIAFAIERNRINEDRFERGRQLLRRIYPAKESGWEQLSQDYADAYVTFFLQKIV